ncbi:hypothetical protein BDQ12DRAFT_490573 [Crucibulum laeve]|uniref:WW domain-containing protein n=1 Tax=Crucibulum laeve TaxID=68775 RepID=A0A5C3M6H6_9AGAR|nr:hypothetical protein BDQ12DRAFT_490573 [Crucibulum laeve]
MLPVPLRISILLRKLLGAWKKSLNISTRRLGVLLYFFLKWLRVGRVTSVKQEENFLDPLNFDIISTSMAPSPSYESSPETEQFAAVQKEAEPEASIIASSPSDVNIDGAIASLRKVESMYEYRSPFSDEYFQFPEEWSNAPEQPDSTSLAPITAAQLLPRRQPIGQDQDSMATGQPWYTDPDLSQDNASIGYIPPLTTSFEFDRVPIGWTPFIHPHGPCYFWNSENRTLTNADLYDPQILQQVSTAIQWLFYELSTISQKVPSDVQLVLDLKRDSEHDGRIMIGYYFASQRGRCLFWLKEKYIKRLFKRVRGVRSHSHVRYLMEAEYWLHYHTFPHVQRLPQETLDELKGLLLYTAIDQTVNMMTTAEHSIEEVNRCIDVADNIHCDIPLIDIDFSEWVAQHQSRAYSVWTVGYLMSVFALNKWDNFHGQKNARWQRDDLLHLPSEKGLKFKYFVLVLSPILFYSPESYLHSLNKILVGDAIFSEAWRNFVKELHAEWNSLIIIATVILATNVAFLAIPTVDNGQAPDTRSPAQILSYISIISSASSIILGQLLARYHRIKGWENLDDRIEDHFEFLTGIGCDLLSIMYSFPYALLSWGMFAFLAAFLVMCFQATPDVARWLVGVVSMLVGLLILWCMFKARGSDEDNQRRAEIFNHISLSIRKIFRIPHFNGPSPTHTLSA